MDGDGWGLARLDRGGGKAVMRYFYLFNFIFYLFIFQSACLDDEEKSA